MPNILIVDDEEYVRRFLRGVVERLNHKAVEAGDGKDALEKFRQESVDLSIVDVNMPEMDGIVFLEEVKKMDPNAVVIMMTGYPSAETIIQTIEDDGYTYIAKPIKIEHIRDLIDKGLDFRKKRLEEKS